MTNYGEGAPDPLGEAVKKFDMHVAAAGVHGPEVVPGTREPNTLPEKAAEFAAEVEAANKKAAEGPFEAGTEDNTASTAYANENLIGANAFIPLKSEGIREKPLDLTKENEV